MPDIRKDDFVGNLFTFLVETFEGPLEFAAYLDQKAGLFETLEPISAAQASKPTAEGGTSIAAQVEHIHFYVDVLEQFMDGRTEKVDWANSWRVREVTPEAWADLQRDLRTAYENVKGKFESMGSWGDDEIGNGMAVVVHTAYHLGAIRQMVKVTAELQK